MENKQTNARPRLALLIGNSRFGDGIAPLPGVIRDITALHLQLSEGASGYRNEDIHLLIEPDLTTLQTNLLQICQDAERLNAQSVLLYFSTHGLYQGSTYQLCTRDSHLHNGQIEQTLSLDTLRVWLAPLATREHVLLLDACRSREDNSLFVQDVIAKDGLSMLKWPASRAERLITEQADLRIKSSDKKTSLPIESTSPRREDLYLQGDNWAILTSAASGEQAWLEREGIDPFGGGPHSLFARALLEELQTPGHTPLDIVSLHESLQHRIKRRLAALRLGATQTPTLIAQYQTKPIIAQRPTPTLAFDGEPFRHLEAFAFEDQGRFFGREEEITQAIGSTDESSTKETKSRTGTGWLFGPHRHHILSAPSGAGKTSFLRAGLHPRLRAKGHLVFSVDMRTPHALFSQLFSYLGEEKAHSLPQMIERCQNAQSGEVILLLDQFESLLLDARLHASWRLLFQQLQILAQHPSPLRYRIVIALREDCVGRLLTPPRFLKETTLDLSDSMLAADTKLPVSDLFDSMLAADTKLPVSDLSDSILAIDTKLPVSDLSDSMLAVEVGEPISDLSDSMLAVSTQRTTLDLSDSMLATSAPFVERDVPRPFSDEAWESSDISIVDALEIGSRQWHTLGFLRTEQAREAILSPLEGRAIQFQEALVFHLLRDLSEHSGETESMTKGAVYPPYLQIVCHRLYGEAVVQGWSSVKPKHYAEIGPFSRILHDHLHAMLRGGRGVRRLGASEQAQAWHILKSLVDIQGKRRVLEQGHLERLLARQGMDTSAVQRSLEALNERRLITCVYLEARPFWTLAHDFLCHLIQQEIEHDPQELALRQAHRSLETLRDEYRHAQQQQTQLPWFDMERAKALLAKSKDIELRVQERLSAYKDDWKRNEFSQILAFLQKSVEKGLAAQQEAAAHQTERERLLREREQMTQQRARWVAWGLSALLVLCATLGMVGLWAYQQQQRAKEATTQSQIAQKAQMREVALGFFEMGLVRLGHYHRPEASQQNARLLSALRALKQAHALFGQLGMHDDQIRTRYRMALAHEQIEQDRESHQHKALAYYKEALAHYQKKKDDLQEAKIKQRIGNIYVSLLHTKPYYQQESIRFLQESLSGISKKEYPKEWATIQNDLGTAWLKQRDRAPQAIPKALAAYEAAATAVQRKENPIIWASVQHNLGVARSLSAPKHFATQQQALRLLQAAHEEVPFVHYPHRWAKTHAAMGDVCLRIAQHAPQAYRDARTHYKQALSVWTPAHFPTDWARITLNYAMALRHQGEAEKKQEHILSSIRLYRSMLNHKQITLTAQQKGDIFFGIGVSYGLLDPTTNELLEKADQSYKQAISYYRLQQNQTSLRKAYENQAIILLRIYASKQKKEREKARQKALEILEKVLLLRKKHQISLMPYQLVYAQVKPDLPLLYRLLQQGISTTPSTQRAIHLAEVALWLQRPEDAIFWWKKAMLRRQRQGLLWRLHLRWQIALHRSDDQPERWCERFLAGYQALKPQRWPGFDLEETRAPWQRLSTPQARTITTALEIFAGPYSCARLRDHAARCGHTDIIPPSCHIPPTSRPHPETTPQK